MHLTIPSWFLMSREYVNLLIWLWPCIWWFHLAFSSPACMWTCWFDSNHASDHCVLLSHFQPVCKPVDLTLTMHLTNLSCFLISSLYVNLLIWLWPCLWPFYLAFSFPACMSTCLFDSDHASDNSILLSHFQPVCQLVDLTLTMLLKIPSCFLISSLYVNLLIWLWPCLSWFYLAFSFPACMSTCWFHSDHSSDHLFCFLISSLYVNLFLWHWLHPQPFCPTFSFPDLTWTCMYLNICCSHLFLTNFSGYVFTSQLCPLTTPS